MDRSKRGPKRSLLVEASGVPVGLAGAVAGANQHVCKRLAETLWSLPVDRPAPSPEAPQHLCLDKGYDYEQVRRSAEAFGFVAHVRSHGEEATEKAGRAKGPRLAGGAHPLLDEPLAQRPHALGQKGTKLPGQALLHL